MGKQTADVRNPNAPVQDGMSTIHNRADGNPTNQMYDPGDGNGPRPITYEDTLAKGAGVTSPSGGGYSPVAQQYGADTQAWDRTTAANRPSIATPYGGQSWSKDANGNWQLSQGFSGPLAGANDSLGSQYAEMLRQPMADGQQARDQAIGAAYGQATSRLDPQWDKRQEALRTQLLNQGLDPSSEAGRESMHESDLSRNDAYTSAMNSAIGQGQAAGDSVFRNNLASRMAMPQQMQMMQDLLKPPGFNAAGSSPTMQILQSLRDYNNNRIGQASQANQNSADTAAGGAQALSALALLMG
jgi:hypothetical protein